MRAAFILVLLLAGMSLILPLGQQGLGADALLAFGFLILAAWTVGELAERMRLPHIFGYLVAGLIFGPYALGIVTPEGVTRLAPLSNLAIALIAFLAGAELRWAEVRLRGVLLTKIVVTEVLLTFALIFTALLALQNVVPALGQLPPTVRIVFCLLFASVAVAHSPAATLAIISETQARGPVARTTLGVVLLSDIAVVLLVTIAVAVARIIAPPPSAGALTVGAVAWSIGGALIIGALLGAGVAVYLRFVRRELTLFAILIAFFGAEIAHLAGVDELLALIVAGFLTENLSVEEHGRALRHAMERAAAPIFVVFFALAGAKINVAGIITAFAIVVPVFFVRAFGIFAGTRLGAAWGGAGPERKYVWLGLISQAGVALGLATMVGEVYPSIGPMVRDVVVALIALNEMIGPILFRRGLAAAGEIEDHAEPRLPAHSAALTP